MKPKGLDDVRHHAAKQLTNYEDWMDVVESFFKKYGFTTSGAGSFGYVAIKEDYPYALKVFRKDMGYLTWYDFCKKNQDNPFVPKIRGKLIKMVHDIFYVRLEKLEEFDIDEPITSKINQLFINLIFYDIHIGKKRQDLTPIARSGNKYIDDIVEELLKNRRMLDIKVDNIMQRKDGTPVLIDPYVDWT